MGHPRSILAAWVAAVAAALTITPAPARADHDTLFIEREQARIQRHLADVEAELLRRDVSHLDAEQRAERARHIEVLRRYRERGLFPRNLDFPGEARPYFRDAFGTLCAMAFLIAESGGEDFVDRIARTRNNAYVHELADEPELVAWLESAGLSVAEAARIQPSYCQSASGCFCTGWRVMGPLIEGTVVATDPYRHWVQLRIDAIHPLDEADLDPPFAVGEEVEGLPRTYAMGGPGTRVIVGLADTEDVHFYPWWFLDLDDHLRCDDQDVEGPRAPFATVVLALRDLSSCHDVLVEVDEGFAESSCWPIGEPEPEPEPEPAPDREPEPEAPRVGDGRDGSIDVTSGLACASASGAGTAIAGAAAFFLFFTARASRRPAAGAGRGR